MKEEDVFQRTRATAFVSFDVERERWDMVITGFDNSQLWAWEMTLVISLLETLDTAEYCRTQRVIAGRNPPVRNSKVESIDLEEVGIGWLSLRLVSEISGIFLKKEVQFSLPPFRSVLNGMLCTCIGGDCQCSAEVALEERILCCTRRQLGALEPA